MPYEVVNTSVAQGLTPNHSGYCDVVRTRGLPEEITPLLAPLNYYDDQLGRGRPAFGVRTIRFGGRAWGVVSRVIPNGNDYTGRPNRLAHHVLTPPSETDSISPARILSQFKFRDSFDGTPRYLDREPEIPSTESNCDEVWTALGGQGWCLHISQLALAGSRLVVLIPPSVDGRSVVTSLVAHLPIDQRWALSVAESSSAEQCWAQGVAVRILTTDLDDESGRRTWPGEVLIDLRVSRTAPAPSRSRERDVAQGSATEPSQVVELDFGAFDANRSEGRSDEGSGPIEVAISFESAPVVTRHGAGERTHDCRPLEIQPTSWKQIVAWTILGLITGGFLGFVIRSAI